MQMGVGIRQSVADVDTDSLLSQNWPPSPSTLEKLLGNRFCHHGKTRTEKTGKNCTERYGIPNFRRFRKSLVTSTYHCAQYSAVHSIVNVLPTQYGIL